jgi:hypothetical protein
MKNIILVLFMFIASISVAQQAEKTLLKTFNISNSEQVVLDIDGVVNVEKWSNPTVRIQMEITYKNANVHVMKYLITKGRYNFKSEVTADGYSISIPEIGKPVQISKDGKMLEETITYTVFVPENVSVILSEASQASVYSLDNKDVAAQ